jgi:hypothetical protein
MIFVINEAAQTSVHSIKPPLGVRSVAAAKAIFGCYNVPWAVAL